MIRVRRYQRFGNNVVQLIHAIHLAETMNIQTIVFPPALGSFTTNRIRVPTTGKPYRGQDISGTFYFEEENRRLFPGLSVLSFSHKQRIATQYLFPILQYTPFQDSDLSPENTIFVHIRSGDIFSDPRPHCQYAQPPLCYYTDILAQHTEKHICVVYEDDKNPVVHALQSKFPEARFLSLSLQETIGVFVQAKHIVSGFGTFVFSMLTMNPNFQTLYVPLSMNQEYYQTDPRVIYYDLPGYITLWKNTEEQRDFMLTYSNARHIRST